MDTTGLEALAAALRAGKKVTLFVGAGISTSAGIPDFRSPETGLYANLARLNLPYAEAVFDIDYFRHHPQAFYTLAHELYPGRFAPTAFHRLVRLLQDKQLLHRVYTQNIDTLERMAGVREEFIVEAHGSFAYNHCIDCGEGMSVAEFGRQLGEATPQCPKCHGHVKPDIVFFGEQLPSRFFEAWQSDCDAVEVAVVAGTSLTVHPFAALPSQVGADVLRVLVNKEAVGDFRARRRSTDVVVEGDCDAAAEALCEMMGWELAAEREAAASNAREAAEREAAASNAAGSGDASEATPSEAAANVSGSGRVSADEAREASRRAGDASGAASSAIGSKVAAVTVTEAAVSESGAVTVTEAAVSEGADLGAAALEASKANLEAVASEASLEAVASEASLETASLTPAGEEHTSASAQGPASPAPASAARRPSTSEALEALSRLKI